MTIETNGAVTPEDALAYAARIIQDQLQVFVNFEEPRKEEAQPLAPSVQLGVTPGSTSTFQSTAIALLVTSYPSSAISGPSPPSQVPAPSTTLDAAGPTTA